MGVEGRDDPGRGPDTTTPASAFRVESAERFVVHVSGDLDALNGGELATLLSTAFGAAPEAVVLDLSELSFVDSIGLSVLVTAHNRGQAAGIPFEVHNVPESCMRVLEITRLVEVLDLR